jgi:hypothetical protein
VAVVSAIHSAYLRARQRGRNEAGDTRFQRAGTTIMTTFDKREEAFEKKYVIDEELKFKAEARRNRMLGLWAADKLGKTGAEADAYAKEVITAEFEDAHDLAVVRKVTSDLVAKGLALREADVRTKMDEFMVQAIAQVKAGT